MSLSLYDASIPVYTRMLGNLSALLAKAEAHAKAKGLAADSLLQARLTEDMAPLTRQVQFASDAAKGGAARLAQVEAPSMPDTETTFAELQARIDKTVAFLATIKRDQVDGGEARTIEMKFPNGAMTFTGQDFLLNFSLPNFFFHVVTAYGLMRGQGVALGKMDYLAGAQVPA